MVIPSLYEKVNSQPRRDAEELLAHTPLKWKKTRAKIIDVGCGGGSVTINILKKYIPETFAELVGCDICPRLVEYAQNNYGTEKVKFIKLDIKAELPNELKGKFDHVFSSYALQWVPEQEMAFSNIYDMLADGGSCLLLILGRARIYEVFHQLSMMPKWRTDLRELHSKFVSPYYDSKDPENEVRNMMKRIGFKDIKVTVTHKKYSYPGGETDFKMLVESLNPFDSLKDRWEDFMNDYVKVDPDSGHTNYWLITAQGTK